MTNNPIDVIFRFRVKPGKLELYKQAIDFILPITEAKESYIDRIVIPARKYSFSGWYIQHLESFRP